MARTWHGQDHGMARTRTIRTMLDSSDSNRPERRSALIAHELSRLNIDIAALSEVRFPEEGSLKEQGAGYTLYWSGRPAGERRLSGVGFMVRNSIASKLETLPTGHSDRIVKRRVLVYCAEWMNNTEVDFPKLLFQKVPKFQHQQVTILFHVFIIPAVSSICFYICYIQYFWFLSIFSHFSYILHLVSSVVYIVLILNSCVINLVPVASVPLSQVFLVLTFNNALPDLS